MDSFELLQGTGPLEVMWSISAGNDNRNKPSFHVRLYALNIDDFVWESGNMIDEWESLRKHLQELHNQKLLHPVLECPVKASLLPPSNSIPPKPPTQGSVSFDTTNLPAGNYIVTLEADNAWGWNRFLNRTFFRIISDQTG